MDPLNALLLVANSILDHYHQNPLPTTRIGFLSSCPRSTDEDMAFLAGVTRKNGEGVLEWCLDGISNPDHETYTPLHELLYALLSEFVREIYIQSLAGVVRDLKYETQVVCHIVKGNQYWSVIQALLVIESTLLKSCEYTQKPISCYGNGLYRGVLATEWVSCYFNRFSYLEVSSAEPSPMQTYCIQPSQMCQLRVVGGHPAPILETCQVQYLLALLSTFIDTPVLLLKVTTA